MNKPKLQPEFISIWTAFLRRHGFRALAAACMVVALAFAVRPGHANLVRAAGDTPIYTDALAGDWQDSSWDTTRDLNNTDPVHSGSASIAVTYTAAWGALYLNNDTPVPVGDYNAVQFWVNGGSTGGQSVMFHVNTGPERYTFTLQANTWLLITVPLSAVGSPATLTALLWQDAKGSAQPTFYVDDISLVKRTYMYEDALENGWGNYSWDCLCILNITQHLHSGTDAISVGITKAWGAFYLHNDTPLPVGGYTAIQFWVNGGTTGGQYLMFHVNTGPERFYFTAQANTWSQVTVPLSALGNPTTLSALMWQDASGHAQPTYYLDEILLTMPVETPPGPNTTVLLPLLVNLYGPPSILSYRGVNLAGAEFGDNNLPGTYGYDYIYPTAEEVDYFMGKGMTIFRLPFRWERLQHAQLAAFDPDEQARMDTFVSYATGKGATVLLDPHNYARYYGDVIGESAVPASAFADFWSRLADHYRSNSRVIFGLMNEPHDMTTEMWVSDAQAAIQAIRLTGATNLILVPGNGWSGAAGWGDNWYGTPDAVAMLAITDPGNNYAFEAHQYLDSDGSGTSETCVSSTIGSERMAYFTSWLRQNHKRAFLGEFGGAANATCLAALDDILTHLDQNNDLYLGWTYWAAGPWWGDYIYSVEPDNGVDKPQMATLSLHLP